MEKYNPNNLMFARANRRQRNATRQEGILWHTFLKKCTVNFARQYRVDNYILDFYAPSIKLAIEVDGSQHYEEQGLESDNLRTSKLNELGITVLRFSNSDIDQRLVESVQQIEKTIAELKGRQNPHSANAQSSPLYKRV